MKSPTEIKEEFDLAIDCSGYAPAMEAAVSLLSQGGRLCIFGVASPKAKLAIEPFKVYKSNINLQSSDSKYYILSVDRFIRTS